MTAVTGVILAGGKSRRMGEDKRFLTVGGTTLLDRCRQVMTALFPEVLIITAQDSPPLDGAGCAVYQDLIPDRGSLGGLYTGLRYAAHERIFAVACDMPFLRTDLVRFFVTLDESADIVMASIGSTLQPLHAVYAKRVLPHLERMAMNGELKIQKVIAEPSLRCRIVQPSEWSLLDPDAQSFRNVNTPADLDAARADAAVVAPKR